MIADNLTTPPAELKDEGLREWHRLAEQLFLTGRLDDFTRRIFIQHCHAITEFHTHQRNAEGQSTAEVKGFTVVHPAVKAMNEAQKTIERTGRALKLWGVGSSKHPKKAARQRPKREEPAPTEVVSESKTGMASDGSRIRKVHTHGQ